MRFMQKFYQRPRYFQNPNDPLFNRDYNVAVGEDRRDKSSLPNILQKRGSDFGKAS